MNNKDVIEAFTIFAKYEETGDVSAEHDEIWAGPNPEIVSAEDRERLDALGWSEDEEYGCFQHFT